MLGIFTTALTVTAIQLLGILGVFFLFGFILSYLQTRTQRIYQQSVGWRGILWTAWIGTPIHELGHVFFAKLFHHRIVSVSLFAPNRKTGGLGHVDHEFSRFSPYQRMGNFFIGAAPMIWGTLILVVLLYWLVPNGQAIFLPLTEAQASPLDILRALQSTLVALFSPENLHTAKFWLFLYLSFCIASHIAPSPQDQKNMWRGFVWIVLLVLLVNTLTLAFGVNITRYVLLTHQYLGIAIALFVYAMIIALIHYLGVTILLRPLRR